MTYHRKSDRCMIVNIASLAALLPTPQRSTYAASKAALVAYSEVMRMELINDGIEVLVINPGYVRTDISRNAMAGKGGVFGALDHEIATGISVEQASERIMDAIRDRKQQIEIYTSPLMRLGILGSFVCPGLYRLGMIKWYEAKKKRGNVDDAYLS
ncbi:hypothetical protein ACOME3_002301 [Neoechinorhynchus agilis]